MPMHMLWPTLLLAAALGSAVVAGETGAVLGFGLDNDQFTPRPTDRFYTNGIRLSLRGKPGSAPFWRPLGLLRLPIWPQGAVLVPETSLSQLMFTPSRYDRPQPAPGDHPYAGMAALTMGYTGAAPRPARGPQRIDQFALTLGIIGPPALAGEAQRLVHRIGNFRLPQGWDTQIGTEPAINLAWQRGWRFAGRHHDITPQIGAALGNVHVHARAGALLRLGAGLEDDVVPGGIDGLLPAVSGLSTDERLRLHLVASAEGRAVARNLFIDGNSFTDGRGTMREPLVAQARAGLVARWRGVQISYVHSWRSREFAGQPGLHRVGNVALAVQL